MIFVGSWSVDVVFHCFHSHRWILFLRHQKSWKMLNECWFKQFLNMCKKNIFPLSLWSFRFNLWKLISFKLDHHPSSINFKFDTFRLFLLPLSEIYLWKRLSILSTKCMKGATEELFVKVTYYKKREGLGSPQWHFTMHMPQCFTQNFFLEKRTSENGYLNFSKH